MDNLTPTQLLETFPKAITFIKSEARELQQKLEDLQKELEKDLSRVYTKYNGFTKWFFVNMYGAFYIYDEQRIKEKIKRAERFIRIDEWKRKPPSKGTITDVEINAAKQVPLVEISNLSVRNGFANCPFHDEKTASFKIYPDNRYHCFSCQKNGDVIDLVMHQHNLNFISAVKYLIKR